MERVGYKLVDLATGDVVQTWGGTWGECPGIPNPLRLPNGDQVNGAQINGEYAGYRLDAWDMASPPPSINDVVRERSRRLAVGFDYNFGTAEAPDIKHVGTSEEDMVGWNEVTSWANAQVALNDTTSTVTIMTDDGAVVVTAIGWLKVVNAATAFRQPIWAASFTLENMTPIPSDYTDNKWWPS